ncbi:MAG: hypothetical protein JST16_11415 [Bdellovibrionales bacterium]|nr:hypothetical protein [Bdellovibrionales bacterium]
MISNYRFRLCALMLGFSSLAFANARKPASHEGGDVGDGANPVTLVCSARIQNQKQSISVRLDAEGKIVYWKKNQIAQAEKTSIFGRLAGDVEEEGYEYIHSFQAPNGYSILQAGTTADEISIGIHSDHKKGFYAYKDLGSGNGNSKVPLTCVARGEI